MRIYIHVSYDLKNIYFEYTFRVDVLQFNKMVFSYLFALLCAQDITISVLLISVSVVLIYLSMRKPRGIPPGPATTLPLIGDLPLLIDGDVLNTFRKLRQKHGDIFSFYFGKDLTIVINGYDKIQQAAVKNGDLFSGRPRNLFSTIAANGKGILFSEGQFWKRQRKFTNSCLQEFGFGKTSLEDKILTEAECFIDVLKAKEGKPFDMKEVIVASIANIVFAIVSGKRYEYDDEFYQHFLHVAEMAAQKVLKISVLLSCAPILQHIPGDPLQMKVLKKELDNWDASITKQYEEHKATHDANNPRDYIDLFITEMVKSESLGNQNDFSLEQMLTVTRDLFGAGSESTATAIQWAVLYLLKHPEIQKRLHEDIDSVIADNELAHLDDKVKLPYVEVFIMEVLRIANIAPLALPHSATTDSEVVLEGFRIPDGCSIIFNLDSVLQDPDIFENPTQFNPDRFLDEDGKIIRPKELIPFGMGRRVCLGEAVAKMEMFLFLTTMLKTFDIVLPEDNCELDFKGILGATYSPKPFKFRAVRRTSSC